MPPSLCSAALFVARDQALLEVARLESLSVGLLLGRALFSKVWLQWRSMAGHGNGTLPNLRSACPIPDNVPVPKGASDVIQSYCFATICTHLIPPSVHSWSGLSLQNIPESKSERYHLSNVSSVLIQPCLRLAFTNQLLCKRVVDFDRAQGRGAWEFWEPSTDKTDKDWQAIAVAKEGRLTRELHLVVSGSQKASKVWSGL